MWVGKIYLGGDFQYFQFSPLVGEMIQFGEHIYFSDGLKPPHLVYQLGKL